jgi:hypothetical protein
MSRETEILAEQEAKVADLRKRADEAARLAEREEDVLRGMRLMARVGSEDEPFLVQSSLSASERNLLHKGGVSLRRGRQPGAISREWRNALKNLHNGCPGGFSISEAVGAAHHVGLPNVKDRDAEDRMRAYLELGYVERVEGGYRVSELAAQKYGFSRQTAEAPTVVAEGAS